MTYSVYRLLDGIFTGQQLNGPEDFVSANTPTGCSTIFGEHNHMKVRVDLLSGLVVTYQPDAPPDNDFTTWQWNEEEWLWVAVPTSAALAFRAREQRFKLLGECDWVVAKAVELNSQVPTEWATYRQALRDITNQESFPESIDWPIAPSV